MSGEKIQMRLFATYDLWRPPRFTDAGSRRKR